mgnify:CR=1 FL=1
MILDGAKLNIQKLLQHYFSPRKDTRIVTTPAVSSQDPNTFFPFGLEDLQYWIVKRKDGLVVKYRVTGAVGATPPEHHYPPKKGESTALTVVTSKLSDWCHHNPSKEPVWIGSDYDLYIADAPGCRGYNGDFDIVLDCGDILPFSYVSKKSTKLEGDAELVNTLKKFELVAKPQPRCLKIDWYDRAAPPVEFEFWNVLAKSLSGAVLTACQGGHGRSGTSLVCLLMVSNPDYTPADAIIHLRAVHCPRAIESVVQHEYIGKFGEYLGRVNDIDRVKSIKDFREAFLQLTNKSAKFYQDRLTAPAVPEKK